MNIGQGFNSARNEHARSWGYINGPYSTRESIPDLLAETVGSIKRSISEKDWTLMLRIVHELESIQRLCRYADDVYCDVLRERAVYEDWRKNLEAPLLDATNLAHRLGVSENWIRR